MNAVQHIVHISPRASGTLGLKKLGAVIFIGLKNQMMDNRPVQLDGKNRSLLQKHLNQVKSLYGMVQSGKDVIATERFQVICFSDILNILYFFEFMTCYMEKLIFHILLLQKEFLRWRQLLQERVMQHQLRTIRRYK